ncbi:competence protein ComEC [Marinomonas balearica]|uniref:Competence protein ComEC n=1 Tax=Marinomonas balearica TaxID=491947 RepID=A0A4R6M7M3_9GAMM|nr:competence protein ComEC [Marinomonas balearica]
MLIINLIVLVSGMLVPQNLIALYSTCIILLCLYLIWTERYLGAIFIFLVILLLFFHNVFSLKTPLLSDRPNSVMLSISDNCYTDKTNRFNGLDVLIVDKYSKRQDIYSLCRVSLDDSLEVDLRLVSIRKEYPVAAFGSFYQKMAFQNGCVAVLLVNLKEVMNNSELSSVKLGVYSGVYKDVGGYESWRYSQALLYGDKSLLTQSDVWVIRQLGLSHLFVVSGMHVGFVCILGWWLAKFIWRFLPKNCVFYLSDILLLRAGVCTFFAVYYASLVGWSDPVKRSVLMACTYFVVQLMGVRTNISTVLFSVMLFMLMLEPFRLISPSFWLSFGMVFVLIAISRTFSSFKTVRTQCMLSLCSLALIFGWQDQISSVSPLANMLMLPVVGLVWFPVIVVSSLFYELFEFDVYFMLDPVLVWLINALEWVAFNVTPVNLVLSDLPYKKLSLILIMLAGLAIFSIGRSVIFLLCAFVLMFSPTFFEQMSGAFVVYNKNGDLYEKRDDQLQAIALNHNQATVPLSKLNEKALLLSGNVHLLVDANVGADYIIENDIDWVITAGFLPKRVFNLLSALDVEVVYLPMNESFYIVPDNEKVIVKSSSCSQMSVLFNSMYCMRVAELNSMLNLDRL